MSRPDTLMTHGEETLAVGIPAASTHSPDAVDDSFTESDRRDLVHCLTESLRVLAVTEP